MSRDCPFCGLIEAGEYEQDHGPVVRFEPLNPVTPGHMLFVPVDHIEHGGGGAATDVGTAMRFAQHYGVRRGEDFNLIVSSGPTATQTVPHVHVHYVPRRKGDGLGLPWAVAGLSNADEQTLCAAGFPPLEPPR